MQTKITDLVYRKHAVYHIEAGYRTPECAVQVTPLSWGLAFAYDTKNGIPYRVAAQVGPIAVRFYFGSFKDAGGFECKREADVQKSVTMKRD